VENTGVSIAGKSQRHKETHHPHTSKCMHGVLYTILSFDLVLAAMLASIAQTVLIFADVEY